MLEFDRFITTAIGYDVHGQYLLGSIRAEDVSKETHPPDKYHFYCPHCLEVDHYCRIIRKPERSEKINDEYLLPDRFHLYNHQHSTHACDHRLRYEGIDGHAQRYNAHVVEAQAHSYQFKTVLPQNSVSLSETNPFRVVDKASRIAKITYDTLYDPGLLQKQSVLVDQRTVALRDFVYDDDRRIELYDAALQGAFTAATFFRPLGNRGLWKNYVRHRMIPGIHGRSVEIQGEELWPSTVLSCKTEDLFKEAKALANRNKDGSSAPIMAFGRASVNWHAVQARIKRLKSGSKEPRAIHVYLSIEHTAQMHEWNYHTSFSKAIKDQAAPPIIKAQMSLAL